MPCPALRPLIGYIREYPWRGGGLVWQGGRQNELGLKLVFLFFASEKKTVLVVNHPIINYKKALLLTPRATHCRMRTLLFKS